VTTRPQTIGSSADAFLMRGTGISMTHVDTHTTECTHESAPATGTAASEENAFSSSTKPRDRPPRPRKEGGLGGGKGGGGGPRAEESEDASLTGWRGQLVGRHSRHSKLRKQGVALPSSSRKRSSSPSSLAYPAHTNSKTGIVVRDRRGGGGRGMSPNDWVTFSGVQGLPDMPDRASIRADHSALAFRIQTASVFFLKVHYLVSFVFLYLCTDF
jgi:hypothetical protein